MRAPSLADPTAPELRAGGRLLVIRFARPHAALSWAVVGGGRGRAQAVVWRQVDDAELGPNVDPGELLRTALAAEGLHDAIGLLTARDLSTFSDVTLGEGRARARCVATVGLGNALAAGDPPTGRHVGTINLLVQLVSPLSEGALVEAVALASEARTAALLELRVRSVRSPRCATGTGTDCIVVVAPEGPGGARYAGKHTVLGAAIGAAVFEATRRGARRWLSEWAARR